MINKNSLKEALKLSIGEQIHINHLDCSAGTDTKKRLYLKRVVGGVVAYCHHCNDKGFLRELNPDGTSLRKWLFDKQDSHPTISLDSSTLHKKFGTIIYPPILKWLEKHYIKKESVAQCGSYHLALPLRTHANTLSGYQFRNFGIHGPKYLTEFITTHVSDCHWNTCPDSPYLYITEDWASAHRLYRDCGVNSIALLRTSMSDSTLTQINSYNFDKVVLWLDPDEAGRKASKQLWDRLSLCSTATVVMEHLDSNIVEPKHLHPCDLRRACGL